MTNPNETAVSRCSTYRDIALRLELWLAVVAHKQFDCVFRWREMNETVVKGDKYQDLMRDLRKVGGNKKCINCGERVRLFGVSTLNQAALPQFPSIAVLLIRILPTSSLATTFSCA
jgi:hypothetical protein